MVAKKSPNIKVCQCPCAGSTINNNSDVVSTLYYIQRKLLDVDALVTRGRNRYIHIYVQNPTRIYNATTTTTGVADPLYTRNMR